MISQGLVHESWRSKHMSAQLVSPHPNKLIIIQTNYFNNNELQNRKW